MKDAFQSTRAEQDADRAEVVAEGAVPKDAYGPANAKRRAKSIQQEQERQRREALATKQEEADARVEVERQRRERARIEAQAAQAKAQADAEAKVAKAKADAEAKAAKAQADAEAKIAKAKAEADAKAAREEQSRADKARAEAEKVAKAEAKAQAEAEASKPKVGKPKQPKVKAPKPLSAAELREAEDLRALEEAQAQAKAEKEAANAKARDRIRAKVEAVEAIKVLDNEWKLYYWSNIRGIILTAMRMAEEEKAKGKVGIRVYGREVGFDGLEEALAQTDDTIQRVTQLITDSLGKHSGATLTRRLKELDAEEGIFDKLTEQLKEGVLVFGEDTKDWSKSEREGALGWVARKRDALRGEGRQHKPFLYSRPDMTPNEKAKERAQHYRTLKQVAAHSYIHVPGAPRTTAHFDAEGKLAKEGRPKLVFLTKEQMETEAARGLNPPKETLPKENSERKPYVGAKMKREFLKTHTAEELKVATRKYKEGGVSWESLL